MNKKDLIKILQNYKNFSNGIESLNDTLNANLWEVKWIESVSIMVDTVIYNILSEKGSDLLYEWLFNNDYEKIDDEAIEDFVDSLYSDKNNLK